MGVRTLVFFSLIFLIIPAGAYTPYFPLEIYPEDPSNGTDLTVFVHNTEGFGKWCSISWFQEGKLVRNVNRSFVNNLADDSFMVEYGTWEIKVEVFDYYNQLINISTVSFTITEPALTPTPTPTITPATTPTVTSGTSGGAGGAGGTGGGSGGGTIPTETLTPTPSPTHTVTPTTTPVSTPTPGLTPEHISTSMPAMPTMPAHVQTPFPIKTLQTSGEINESNTTPAVTSATSEPRIIPLEIYPALIAIILALRVIRR